mmetsp:Transcript_37383/g.103194  ORF Transcript_37383/g.103194 Transcript_37383/m.103194 type:complete len:245 (+) Transcript_37383:271-1005(+)
MFKGSKSGKAGSDGTKAKLGPPKEAAAAYKALAALWKEFGVEGGEFSKGLGTSIDHVLHAVADGRTTAQLDTPLLAVLEVALHDVILPLRQDIAVLRAEWAVLFEKVEGIVLILISMRQHYSAALPSLKAIGSLLFAVYTTARACGPAELLTLHLTEAEYDRNTKAALRSELVGRMVDLGLQISIEVLRLKLEFEQMEYPHAGTPAKLQLMAYAQSKMSKGKGGGAGGGKGSWWMPKSIRGSRG